MPKLKNNILLTIILILLASPVWAAGSFRLMGDGKIKIGRGYNGKIKTVAFRDGEGNYLKDGLKEINDLYGTDYDRPEARMSLRLIELLDYLEDHFGGKGVRIVSGYRDPAYNQALRDNGKLAASSSLHMDAEATDIVMEGVASSTINDYLIPQNCCGVGYYHGKTVHIDTGPPRFWDEKTSGTEKKEPPLNEHITIKTKSDFYKVGQKMGLKFSRVTDYPIGVKKTMVLRCKEGKRESKKNFPSEFEKSVKHLGKGCYELKNRKEGRTILATIPKMKAGRKGTPCQLRAYFCDPKTEKMPEYVDSNVFTVKKD